jgi:large subunit ribosomal protein LX
MEFEIQGTFKASSIGNVWRQFTKVVETSSEKSAKEMVYSLMGSEHGLKRNLIKIKEVKALGQ